MNTLDREGLRDSAGGEDWYHTLELAPGVVTQGVVDLRKIAPRVLPADLGGKRALDVGTYDGFWAFELERRGAQVLAVDLDAFLDTDWKRETKDRLGPQFDGRSPGERFASAHKALNSRVRRIGSSIYDLESRLPPEPIDYAVVGDLLLHLRDPVRGLEAVRGVLAPGGRLLLMEPVGLWLSVLGWRRPLARLRARRTEFDWWVGNAACLHDWLLVAGFENIERRLVYRLPAVRNMRQWHVAFEARRPLS